MKYASHSITEPTMYERDSTTPRPLLPVCGAASVSANEPAFSASREMRASVARTLSTAWLLATMKRTDSGIFSSNSTPSSSGVTPPRISTLRQPKCGIIHAARKPPNAAPSGKPQNIRLITVARRLSGQNSPIIVTAFGIAAPVPTPVMKRRIVRCPIVVEKADIRHATPNRNTEPSSSERRPSLSDSGPTRARRTRGRTARRSAPVRDQVW